MTGIGRDDDDGRRTDIKLVSQSNKRRERNFTLKVILDWTKTVQWQWYFDIKIEKHILLRKILNRCYIERV